MVTDFFDMSKVLSCKLGMLPNPTLNTAPWFDLAHQFPGAWRSLVKLDVSKRVDMDQSVVMCETLGLCAWHALQDYL